MEKKYEAPVLEEQKVEIEDIIAASGQGSIVEGWLGDYENPWPFK